jgi:hypothetical protein
MNNTFNNNINDICDIILDDQFPEDVSKVGKQLLQMGPSSISEIFRKLGSDFISVRNALIVLIQNKMVNFQEVKRKDSKEYLYELDLESILNVLRYPKILYFINQKYGQNGVLIFEEFMQYGVLSFNQCIEQIGYKQNRTSANYLNNLKLSFLDFIENNYIIQVAKIKNEEIKGKKENSNYYLIIEKPKQENNNLTLSNKKKKKAKADDKMIIDDDDFEDNKKEKTSIVDNLVADDHPLVVI